jgi:hypothetical protein
MASLLLASGFFSHVLVAMGASDVHAHQVESRRLDISLFGVPPQIGGLFLEVSTQAFVLWSLIDDVPPCCTTGILQHLGAFFHLIKLVECDALQNQIHVHQLVTHQHLVAGEVLGFAGFAVFGFANGRNNQGKDCQQHAAQDGESHCLCSNNLKVSRR